MLVTDSTYYLPQVLAMAPDKTFATGANQPLLLRGFCQQIGREEDYVLKGSGGERMGPAAFERELLGSYAAWQVGLQAVEPVQVTVLPEFAELLRGQPAYGLIAKSIGSNYGSVFRQGREFVAGQPLSTPELEQAKLIFAFDVLIQNPDRRPGKQNMLTDGTSIVLLDHELAFSFTQALFPARYPWLIPDEDLHWIRNHYFYSHLRGKRIDFRPLSVKLQQLDASFWAHAQQHVPPEWRTAGGPAIEAYLSKALTHVEEFTTHLNRITAA